MRFSFPGASLIMTPHEKVPGFLCLIILLVKCSCLLADSVCDDLPVLNNGRLILDGKSPPFMVGDSIKYACNVGYMADLTNPRIFCTNETESVVANWTRTDKLCKKQLISCNDPGDIENAVRKGNVFTFPNNITYVCNEGFKIVGTPTRYCSPKGHWLPKAPVCEAIICPFLSEIQNGKVISSERHLHAVVRYECEKYFNLSGNAERTCQEDGTWTGDVPVCKEITCPDPGVIEHVRVIPPQPQRHKAGDLVIFKCKYGPHQISSKCLESGEWNKRPPICPGPAVTKSVPDSTMSTLSTEGPEIISKLSCDDPGTIKNGATVFTGLSINSTVTYTCEEGYELRGKGTLLCMANGKWDLEKLPICVKPLSIPSIIGIVFGVLTLVACGIGAYFLYRWRENKIRGYGAKCKALTADAADVEEITGLEKKKKPIPVTVL
ncbi:hypothetical protein JTE90_016858 [Oedothorax gibbosus]|uniref:Sushi domain-containing protein n=1 Tax=Oedothorax gibbosus TaxID=931172 RepID=A0AAV6VZD2_9ARAC|nr:hypothetical protein JTE90_016858 [Oedothorax gibbosus]